MNARNRPERIPPADLPGTAVAVTAAAPRLPRVHTLVRLSPVLAALLLGACVQLRPGPRPPADGPAPSRPMPGRADPEQPGLVEPAPADPMAEVSGDRPLPVAQGGLERIDCLSGRPELHARIAFEAVGGQVMNFAYYSRWNSYTCSMDIDRADPRVRWRMTPEGATRVQTPHGMILIRAQPDAYVFEFLGVQRMKFCGMFGEIKGTLKVKRTATTPECAADGILDR
jgi:hypothetical protein